MKPLLFSLSTNDIYIISSIIAGILIVGIILFLVLKKRKQPKPVQIVVSTEYVSSLYEALGERHNITSLSLEHKRLKVGIKDVKKVDQSILKRLEISAFLVGKELKLLIKNDATKVYELLEKKVGEK